MTFGGFSCLTRSCPSMRLTILGADVEQPYMYVQMQRRSTILCVIPALYHVVKPILKPFKLSFQMSDSSPLIYRRRRPIAPDPEPQLDVSKTSSRGNRVKKKRKTKAVVALRKKTSTRRYQRHTLSPSIPSFAYSLFNSQHMLLQKISEVQIFRDKGQRRQGWPNCFRRRGFR